MKFSVKNLIFIFAKPSEYELQMLKKYLFSFFLLITFLGFAQTPTNTHITDSLGVKIPDVLYYCKDESFNLKVNSSAVSSNSYNWVKLTSTITLKNKLEVKFHSTNANVFSETIPLGFNFNFYGKTYDKIVVGRNGRIVLSQDPEIDNLKDETKYVDRAYSGVNPSNYAILPSSNYNKIYKNNDSQEFPLAQIFSGYTDIYFSASYLTKTFYYYDPNFEFDGSEGVLVYMQGLIRTDGTGGTSDRPYDSYVLILRDGRIIIRVQNKKESFYNAIIGIQNETGTNSSIPSFFNPNFNNGKWVSDGETFECKPNLKVKSDVIWYVNGVDVYHGDSYPNYTPSGDPNEKLEVKILYVDGTSETSSVVLNKIQTVVVKDPVYTSGCGNPAKLEIDSPATGLTYHWFNVLNPATEIGSGTSINVGTGSYIAKAKSSSGGFCGESLPKVVNVASILPVFAPPVGGYTFCDNLGSSSKIIDLNTLTSYPADVTKYTVTFLENGTPISSSVTMNSGISRNFTIKVETLASVTPSCTFVTNFTVNYQSFPTSGAVISSTNKLCFDANSYSINQFKVDFPQYASFDVKFSSDNVNFDSNDKNPHNPIYVELKKSGFTCSSVLVLNVSFESPVIANKPIDPDPQCASASQYFDLVALKSQINPDPNIEITFHQTLGDAKTGAQPQDLQFRSGIGTTALYIRVINKVSNCVATNIPTVDLVVYRKPSIKISNPIVKTNCEGNTFFNLRYSVSEITDADPSINAQLVYFSQSGILLSDAEIDNYNASVYGLNPYIEVKFNSTCSDRVNFKLQYNPKPVALKTTFAICGETTYASSLLLSEVIVNPANYTFTMGDGSPLPTKFDVSSLPKTITILIKDNTSGCVSDPIDITFSQGQATPILTTSPVQYSLCDSVGDAYDGITLFDLNSKKSSFTNDASAKVQFYTDAARQNEVQANFTNTTAFNQTIYVKITAIGACPSFGELVLKVNSPTKSTTLKDKYPICFGSQVSVDAGIENVKFNWSGGVAGSTPNIRVFDKAGMYSVVLENINGCSYTHSFAVSDEQQPKVQIIQDNTKIEVIASGGVPPYRYSFDGGLTFQNSNILLNPTDKEYVIQVQSTLDAANGLYCNSELTYLYSIVVPNAITPNGDGINDTWTIPNLDKMDQVEVVITDRFGKNVFKTSDKNQLIWDGKHNGKALITGTYWYVVKWFDPSTKKNEVRQGWILLKNRN